MNYHPAFSRISVPADDFIGRIRIQCPCCQEQLEIEMPSDCTVSVVHGEEAVRPRITARERRGSVPLTTASRSMDEETMKLAMQHGWSLPPNAPAPWVVQQRLDDKTKSFRRSLLVALSCLAVIISGVCLIKVTRQSLQDHSAELTNVDTPGGQLVKTKRAAALLAEEAKGTLRRFAAATSLEEKLSLVIEPERVGAAMKEYYAKAGRDEKISVDEFVDCLELVSEEDVKRGITYLAHSGPVKKWSFNEGQANLADLDVSNVVHGTGRLYFFRDGKLDWETFAQQRQQSLAQYVKIPQSGSQVFRVIVSRLESTSGIGQTILLHDICQMPQVLESVDYHALTSQVAKELDKVPSGSPRLATIELAWVKESVPTLTISKFVCWESQGVNKTSP